MAYLHSPEVDAQTRSVLRAVKRLYEEEITFVDDVLEQPQELDANGHRQAVLEFFKGRQADESSVAFVIGFPRTNELQSKAVKIGNMRYSFQSNTGRGDVKMHLRMFQHDPSNVFEQELQDTWDWVDRQRPTLFPAVRTSIQPSSKKLTFHPVSEEKVYVADVDGNATPLGQNSIEDPVLDHFFRSEDPWEGADTLKSTIQDAGFTFDETSVSVNQDRMAHPIAVPGVDRFTHIVLQPRNVKREVVFYPSGSTVDHPDYYTAEENVMDDFFNAEARADLTPKELKGNHRIYLLEIKGSGFVTIRGEGLSRVGGKNFVQGRPGLRPSCTLVQHELNLEEVLAVLQTLVPHLHDYEKPPTIDEPSIELYADMMRHIAWKEVAENNNMPPHKLARTMNLFTDLVEQQEEDEQNAANQPARNILERTFELMYGNWNHAQEEPDDDGGIVVRQYRLIADASGVFGPSQSEWKLLFDLRSIQQLRADGIEPSDLRLLPNGMRLIRSTAIQDLDVNELTLFPHAERIPREPYQVLHACFDDEALDAEVESTSRFQRLLRQNVDDETRSLLTPTRTGCMSAANRNSELRIFRSTLNDEGRRPLGWEDIETTDEPFTLEDNEGGRMEFNCYTNVKHESTHHGGPVQRVFLLTYTDSDGRARTTPVFHLKRARVKRIPKPWRGFAEGLVSGVDFNMYRYELLNDILRAFLCCVHRHQPLDILVNRGTDLLPTRHRQLLRDRWSQNPSPTMLYIRGLDEDLHDQINNHIREAFWLPTD